MNIKNSELYCTLCFVVEHHLKGFRKKSPRIIKYKIKELTDSLFDAAHMLKFPWTPDMTSIQVNKEATFTNQLKFMSKIAFEELLLHRSTITGTSFFHDHDKLISLFPSLSASENQTWNGQFYSFLAIFLSGNHTQLLFFGLGKKSFSSLFKVAIPRKYWTKGTK